MAESIKPDNVIIVKDPEAPGGERAKVLDFGIAEVSHPVPFGASMENGRSEILRNDVVSQFVL